VALNPDALALIAAANKEFGDGSAYVASRAATPRRFTTGSLSLDLALGGGWRANQWNEIYGAESSGKTAITLKAIAANQRLNPDHTTLWVGAEPYDEDQATALGVNNEQVILCPTRDMVYAYETVEDYLKERAVDFTVIDSYPALIAPVEDEKEMGDYQMAEGARLTAKFFRKIGKAGQRDPEDPDDRPFVGIFINQLRAKPGVWSPSGEATTTPGGYAKNYAFISRLEVIRSDWIQETISGKGKTRVGQVIRARTVKNKGGPPQRVASIDFYFTDAPVLGFKRGDYDVAKDVVTMGVLFDVVQRRGSYYDFGDVRWKGKDAMFKELRDDEELLHHIREDVLAIAANPIAPKSWNEEDIDTATKSHRRVVKNGKN
jgi:recombination protein RecA